MSIDIRRHPTKNNARLGEFRPSARIGFAYQNEQAQEVSAGILKPIYRLAEAFSFPAFHWIAFAVMVAGVVSFALQLTLGKLVVLARFGFSLAAIFSDALGLAVSLVGFTTRGSKAATLAIGGSCTSTSNSCFARNQSAVLADWKLEPFAHCKSLP